MTNSEHRTTPGCVVETRNIPAATNVGRFGYTGQTWLPEVGMWYYKARMYSPTLGRFLQTDLMGYQYGMNWYGYVGADPVNFVDPSGMITQVSNGKVYRWVCVVVEGYSGGCGWVAQGFAYEGFGSSFITALKNVGDGIWAGLNKVVRCTRKQLGVDDAAASLATIAGHNGIATAGKFGGAVKGTSVASIVARSALSWVPDSKIRLPTITGGLLSGRPQKVIFVKSVGAFVGRAIPVVGTAYLAYDIGSVVYCSVK